MANKVEKMIKMTKKECIAIIPARGGSKRIPKKNIKDFLGKPIIAYSIEAALQAEIFDEIMVSTDSEEIAEVARMYGANVPFMRNPYLADDMTTSDDVLLDVLKRYKEKGFLFKYMACIYATAPFVTPDALRNAMKVMKEHDGMTQLIPMAPYSYPPQRCHVINAKGEAVFKYPEYITTRSQDLEKMYHDIGQYYIYDVDRFVEVKGLVYDKIVPLVVDEFTAQDIDTEQDWKIAEMKYKILKNEYRESLMDECVECR